MVPAMQLTYGHNSSFCVLLTAIVLRCLVQHQAHSRVFAGMAKVGVQEPNREYSQRLVLSHREPAVDNGVWVLLSWHSMLAR